MWGGQLAISVNFLSVEWRFHNLTAASHIVELEISQKLLIIPLFRGTRTVI